MVSCQQAPDKEYDTRAINALDEMSETIGELKSCSYTLSTAKTNNGEKESKNIHDVYYKGSNKMYINSVGAKAGERSYWYNGSELAFFSYNKNMYDTISAPESIIATIDLLHDKYGIDFPASDFFYPTLTDDIIQNYTKVLYDDKTVNDVEYKFIQASNKDETVKIWIDKTSKLPYKLEISSSKKYYSGTFSNWRTNQKLPDILFEFDPPENSTRKKIAQKN